MAGAACETEECCAPSCGDIDNDGDGGVEADDGFPAASCTDAGLALRDDLFAAVCQSGTCGVADCCIEVRGPACTPPPTPDAVISCDGRSLVHQKELTTPPAPVLHGERQDDHERGREFCVHHGHQRVVGYIPRWP